MQPTCDGGTSDCNAGLMEAEATLTTLQRSLAKYGLWCATTLSNGDSQTFQVLRETGVQGFLKVDCTNHVHKRMTAALHSLRLRVKNSREERQTDAGQNQEDSKLLLLCPQDQQ